MTFLYQVIEHLYHQHGYTPAGPPEGELRSSDLREEHRLAHADDADHVHDEGDPLA